MCKPQIELYPPPDKRQRPDIPLADSKAGPSKWTGTLPDKYIATLVSLVSQQNITTWVQDLSAYHTRHSKSAYIHQVANWLVTKFQGCGYTDVVLHPYTKNGYQLNNVVCKKPGVGDAGQVIILCGHYDSRMADLNNATAQAPGADDNATGIAVILELARILAQVELTDAVQFVAFSGEEQGLWGSTAYAQHLKDTNVDLRRLINLDMVGYPPATSAIIVERDTGNQVSSNDQPSQSFAGVMAQMAADYTNMPVQLGPIYASDYMPFEARGYVVIGAYEGGDNPNYHTSNDTPNTVDFAYVADVARMTLATLLQETAAVVDEGTSPVDVYIRDSSSDTGDQPSGYPHWQSPDIWVRNNPPPADPNDPGDPNYGEDPDDGHQNPINNVPNYMYVRVHNKGTQPTPVTGFSVKAFHCNPGTGMIWPDHFQAMGTLPITTAIPAGGSVRLGPFIWTPQIQDHECLLAIASGPGDHAIPDVFSGKLDHSLLVRFDNNVGQRNVSPQNSVPGGKTKTSFLVRGTSQPSINTLRIDASALPADTKLQLRILRRLTDQAAGFSGFTLNSQSALWSTLDLRGGVVGAIEGFPLSADDQVSATLTIDFSYQAEHLQRYPIVAAQEQDGRLVGQLTIEITAVKETEDYVYGNPRSGELHTVHCPFWSLISQRHKVPFALVQDGLARGYNGCAYCLPDYDSG